MDDHIVILGAKRTPIGSFQGQFSPLAASDLGATAIKAALAQSGVSPDRIAEVIMGCVLSAGQGQAPARQAAIKAEIPKHVGALTINKMCGSGLKAVMLAHDMLKGSNGEAIIAGGLESMTNAPYLLPKSRAGMRMGHGQVLDSMFLDGLEDAYETGTLMGVFAERTAREYKISREAQDEFALQSLSRAQHALMKKEFAPEIAEVSVTDRKGNVSVFDEDEQPKLGQPDKIPTLKPAFAKDGSVTAANSSSISDGAAALVLAKRSNAEKWGHTPLATICGHYSHAQEPAWFTTAPVGAISGLLEKLNWPMTSVDLFEINEAFAVVTLAAINTLGLPHDRVNIHGGACALGHPIGASGARILTTLIHALIETGGKRGIASLCIGGGEAVALAVEVA